MLCPDPAPDPPSNLPEILQQMPSVPSILQPLPPSPVSFSGLPASPSQEDDSASPPPGNPRASPYLSALVFFISAKSLLLPEVCLGARPWAFPRGLCSANQVTSVHLTL